uniref:non-specific serine/threonine protein kinase n=1 Tax=Blastobotrys adeninivorans TaxID=409370 RepID=A0A060SYS6_BLAAD
MSINSGKSAAAGEARTAPWLAILTSCRYQRGPFIVTKDQRTMSLLGDILYSLTNCLTCFQSPSLRINRRRFNILRLLGEGGFSYVYLVEDDSGQKYALKKIRCAFGAESVQVAMREMDAYRQFKSHYVIPVVDSSIVQEKDGSKTAYIILPYYANGNLQDRINDNLISGSHFDESELIDLFIDVCKAVKVMHNHCSTGSPLDSGASGEPPVGGQFNDQSEEEHLLSEGTDTALGEVVPYAHRDLKPANIMIDDEGRPVLMDLGSCSRARVSTATRQDALELQDLAAEHCTMSYRAPELFDVRTGSSVDERVDIWSLGCTLFTLMYSGSPFELEAAESGASLSLAVQSGKFKFPSTPEYSQGLKDIVTACLNVDPTKRPFIDDVLRMAERLKHGDSQFAIRDDDYDQDPLEL